jgi:LmbE family N-acetylglucosaminyl deacetylase
MAGSPDNAHPESLAQAQLEVVAHQVAGHMRDIRPQVVITSDPNGGYGHPDHIAVHRATVEAFRLTGDAGVELDGLAPHAPQKLYYHTFPRGWLKRLARVMGWFGADLRHFGKNGDIDLLAVLEADVPVHAIISTRSVAPIKAQASACHASQGGGAPRGVMTLAARLMDGREHFSRAVPAGAPGRMERDLFEGVVEG